IRNFRPDRWPAGDPEMYKAVGPFGDCDNSPSKEFILARKDESPSLFRLAFEKRPAEELYDLANDPYQLTNVVSLPKYAASREKMRSALEDWLKSTADPRATDDDDRWDGYP